MDHSKPPESTAAGEAAPPAGFYDPHRYAAERSIGYLMKRVVTLLAQDVDRRFEAEGLTHAQWLPVFKLSQGHGDTVAELSRACDSDPGAMTRLIDRLEGKGLLRRVRSTSDRRVVHLELTVEGQEVAARVPFVLSAALNEVLTGFEPHEFDALTSYLKRLLSNIESRQSNPTGKTGEDA